MCLNSPWIVATGVVICLLTSGCETRLQTDVAQNETSAAALPKVTTSKPIRKTLTQKTTQPGRIEAFSTTPIHAKIGGYVDLVKVDIGDRVTGPKRDAEGRIIAPGQTLAVLTAPEVEEELHQKQAMVEQVAAEVLQAEAAVRVAESMLVSAKAGVEEYVAGQDQATAEYERWKSEYERMKTLAKAKTITEKLVDEAELQFRSADASRSQTNARVKSAEAALHEASVSIEKAQADVQAVKSHLRVAEADRDRVSALRDYLQITAPFGGIITERRIDPGHLVQPARSAADTPLFVLVQADTVRLFVDVPESDAGLVEKGRPAKITISAQGNIAFDGTVARTGWALQSGTRALRCEIDVPNPDGHLRPGMYAQVELTVAERSDVLAVPKTAIVEKDGQSFCVTVASDGTILRKPVQTGIRSATDVEVTSGLDGSEEILTANAAAFSDGQLVEKASK